MTNRLLILALLLSLSGWRGSTPVFAQERSAPEYIVQAGDSLFSIALAFGTTVAALQDANGIADPSLLAVGARLVIPGFDGVEGVLTTYRLAPGDNLTSLALRLNFDREALIRLNRIVNPSMLYLGQPIVYAMPETDAEPIVTNGRYSLVGAADTLANVAIRRGLAVAEIVQTNALAAASNTFAGQRLQIEAGDEPFTGLVSPLKRLSLRPARLVQGEPFAIIAELDGDAEITGALDGAEIRFVDAADGSGRRIALQGIHAFAEPGIYPLSIALTLPSGESTEMDIRIPIAGGDYEFQAITLPPEQSALLDAERSAAESQRIAALASEVTPERYWRETFSAPVNSDRITSVFGLRRSYNGGPYNSFHGGIDMGGPPTTPVLATAGGVVVLSERLEIRGIAVAIDHGWGVYSGYWHMSAANVTVGQTVAAGEQVGFIGSSGLSTGDHLHWEIWVGGNQVNPWAWLALQVP